MPSLRVANLIRDRKLLELAKSEARGLVDGSAKEVTAEEKRMAVQYLEAALEPAIWAGGGGVAVLRKKRLQPRNGRF